MASAAGVHTAAHRPPPSIDERYQMPSSAGHAAAMTRAHRWARGRGPVLIACDAPAETIADELGSMPKAPKRRRLTVRGLSRWFGAIPDSAVVGRASVIIWPLGRIHWL